MRSLKKKIGLVVLSCGILYAVAFGMAVYRAKSTIQQRFGSQAEVTDIRLFLDGVVLGHVSFPEGTIDRLFLQGNPVRLLFFGPKRIWVERAELKTPQVLLKRDTVPAAVTLEIDQWRVAFPSFALSGALKTIGSNHYLTHFKASDPTLALEGKAEIKRQKDGYLGFDLEFDEARMEQGLVAAWRASGWAHVAYENKEWQVMGQANAGRVTMGDLDLADPVLRLGGTLAHPQISFSGISGAEQTPVSMDTTDQDIVIAYKDISKKIARDSFNKKQLKAVSAFIRHDLEPHPEPAENKTAATEKPVEEMPVLEDNFEVVEMDLPQKDLSELIRGSFFEGLRYDRPLTVVTETCGSASCWKARGQGGILSYTDEAVPSYLLRLTDYEQSVQLRDILRLLPIERLTVIGEGDKATKLIVKGRLADDREVHIELSLDDVH